MRALLLASLVLFLLNIAAAQAEYRPTILHTNDTHSRFLPVDRFDHDCSAEDNAAGKCFGGAARRATAVADARAGAVRGN